MTGSLRSACSACVQPSRSASCTSGMRSSSSRPPANSTPDCRSSSATSPGPLECPKYSTCRRRPMTSMRLRLLEFQVGLEHHGAEHRVFAEQLFQRLQAAFAARTHQPGGLGVHVDRDGLFAVGGGAEQEFLARVGDQRQAHRLVGDTPDRRQQGHAVAVGGAGVDGHHAAVADDEAGVADAAQVVGVDLTRRTLHHVHTGGHFDGLGRDFAGCIARRRRRSGWQRLASSAATTVTPNAMRNVPIRFTAG